jgi:hypothetical protein
MESHFERSSSSYCGIGFLETQNICKHYLVTVETQKGRVGERDSVVISQPVFPLPPSGETENLRNLRQGRKPGSSQNLLSVRGLVSVPGAGEVAEGSCA